MQRIDDIAAQLEQWRQGSVQLGIPLQQGGNRRHAAQKVRCDRLACEVPQHCSQLVLLMEAQTVINGPQLASRLLDEYMAALAIGVVD